MTVQKIKSGRILSVTSDTYVGQPGTLFYEESLGDLRLSDGETPGGIPIGGSGGGSYTLPTATPTRLGGVKIDNSTIKITNGVISANLTDYATQSWVTSHGYLTSVSWDQVSGKPSFFSGSYNDLTNKPALFDGNYNSLTNKPTIPTVPTAVSAFTNDAGYLTSASVTWTEISGKPLFATVATSGSYNDLTNLPTLFSGNYNDLSNLPTIPTIPTAVSAFTNDAGYITSTDRLISGSYTLQLGSNGSLTTPGSILPTANNVYDLGSPTEQWRHLYVSSGSVYIDNVKLSVSNNQLQIQHVTNNGTVLAPVSVKSVDISTTAPIVQDGGFWFSTITNQLSVGVVNQWRELSADVQTTDTAPAGAPGKLWYNSSEGRMFVYYNDSWVDSSPLVVEPLPQDVEFTSITFDDLTVQTTAFTPSLLPRLGTLTFDRNTIGDPSSQVNLIAPAHRGGYTAGYSFGNDVSLALEYSHLYLDQVGTWSVGSNHYSTEILGANTNGPTVDTVIIKASGNQWVFGPDGSTYFPNYAFPANHGTSGQVLTDNGSGTLSWTTISGGGGGSSDRITAGGKTLSIDTNGVLSFPNTNTLDTGGPAFTIKSQNNITVNPGSYSWTFGSSDGILNLPNAGGWAYLQSQATIQINANGNHWNFGTDGKLILPGEIWAKAGDSYDGIRFSPNGSTTYTTIKVDDGANLTLNNYQNIYVKRSGAERINITDTAITLKSQDGTKSWAFGEDGTLNLPTITAAGITTGGWIQAAGKLVLNANGSLYRFDNDLINLPDGNTVLGNTLLTFGKDNSKLGAPNHLGTTDKIRIWDFNQTNPTGYNYAIGAEGDHVWFSTDVMSDDGGFKFYSQNQQVLKIGGAGKVTTHGSIVPDANNAYDLGAPDKQWRHIYVSAGSIYLDNIKLSTANNQLKIEQVNNVGGQTVVTNVALKAVDISPTAPIVQAGGLWYNDTNSQLSVGVNNHWVNIRPEVEMTDAPPMGEPGKLWYNSQEGRVFVYYGGTWIDANPLVAQPLPQDVEFTSVTFDDLTVQTTAFTPSDVNLTKLTFPDGTVQTTGIATENGLINLKGLLIGTLNRTGHDKEGVIWADEDSEYAGLWWGGNRNYLVGGYGPKASIVVGSEQQDERQDVDPTAEPNTGVYINVGNNDPWFFGPDGATHFPSYIFPSNHGTAGQVLTDNGGGLLSWATPGGSDQSLNTTSNVTFNTIAFTNANLGAPTTSSRSAGAKLVLWPESNVSGHGDYAIGMEDSHLWNSVPTTSTGFKWYAGTSQILKLGGNGQLFATNEIWARAGDGIQSITFSPNGTDISAYIKVDGGQNTVYSANGYMYLRTSGTDRLAIASDTTLSSANAVKIKSSGTTNTWTFGTDGKVTFPDNTVQSSAYQVTTAPLTSKGASGNRAGMIAFDNGNFYYCKQDYVAVVPTITLTVNNIRGPAQNAGYSNNGGGYGTMVGFDGPIAGLASGQTFVYNTVTYTIQDVSNTSNQYAYIVFTPQMSGYTLPSVVPGTQFTIGTGATQPDIWVKTAWTSTSW